MRPRAAGAGPGRLRRVLCCLIVAVLALDPAALGMPRHAVAGHLPDRPAGTSLGPSVSAACSDCAGDETATAATCIALCGGLLAVLPAAAPVRPPAAQDVPPASLPQRSGTTRRPEPPPPKAALPA